jgi:hypothetical protein
MTDSIYTAQIKQELEKVRLCRHQMVIVVGGLRSKVIEQFALEAGIEPINLNLRLSELLLDLPLNRRSRKVGELVNRLVMECGDVVVLAHIELLFLPELQVDPMRLFEDLSRDKVLVIDWNGKYDNGVLIYASSGHPEYRIYHEIEASIIQTD